MHTQRLQRQHIENVLGMCKNYQFSQYCIQATETCLKPHLIDVFTWQCIGILQHITERQFQISACFLPSISKKMSKISTKAVIKKLSDLTLRYTPSEIIGHLQVSDEWNVLHSLIIGVVQLFGLSTYPLPTNQAKWFSNRGGPWPGI